MTELKTYKTFESLLYSLYNKSILPKLKSPKFFIPIQFPPQLIRFLKENLAKNNTIINTKDLNDLQLNDD